jgi:hypothetical protein
MFYNLRKELNCNPSNKHSVSGPLLLSLGEVDVA